jgi:hypothetical protein
MKDAIRRTTRWLLLSAPGALVLVVSAALGFGYAAASDDEPEVEPAPHPDEAGIAIPAVPGGIPSQEDREALDRFHECMRDSVEVPEDGEPPDPEQVHEAFQAAFEQCKAELPEDLRQLFEQRQQQLEAFRSCMEEHGATPPVPGEPPPSQEDLEQLRRAHEACQDELPDDAGPCGGPGGPVNLPIAPPPGPDPGGPGGLFLGPPR